MRRRRLALRQIAETTQHVSDIDDDDDDDDTNGGTSQQDKPPTFSLLTVTTAPGAKDTATIELSDSDASDAGNTTMRDDKRKQGNDNGSRGHTTAAIATAATLNAADNSNDSSTHTRDSDYNIFHLYQEGLAPDQVLQLAYTRRRARRATLARPGDDFVLPLSSLTMRDVLAAAPPVDLHALFADELPRTAITTEPATGDTAVSDELSLASAKQFLYCPEATSLAVRQSWQTLSEHDWRSVYSELKSESNSDATQQVTAAAVCVLLRDCKSDALARFVWRDLVPSVLQKSSEVTQKSNTSSAATHHKMLTLLLQTHWVRAMAPTAFRAEVRAANLRQRLGNSVYGAQVELELLALYHRSRQRQL